MLPPPSGLVCYALPFILSSSFLLCPLNRSFGQVYKALHRHTGQTVAVKLIPIDDEYADDADDQSIAKVIKEINNLKKCDSPYVTSFYASYYKDKKLWVTIRLLRSVCSFESSLPSSSSCKETLIYLLSSILLQIVMEFCSAGSLKKIMTKQKAGLSEEEIAAVCYQVVKGLIYLHSNRFIHRDIKAGTAALDTFLNVLLLSHTCNLWRADNILLNAKGAAKLGNEAWHCFAIITKY